MKQKNGMGKKLALQLLRIYMSVMAVVVFLAFLVVFPAVLQLGKRNAANAVEMIRDQYATMQQSVNGVIRTMVALKDLTELTNQYDMDPSAKSASEIELYLDSVQSAHENILVLMVERVKDGRLFASIGYSEWDLAGLLRSNPYYTNLRTQNTSYFSPFYLDTFRPSVTSGAVPLAVFSQTYRLGKQRYIISVCYSVQNLLKNNRFTMEQILDGYLVLNRQGECIYATDADMVASTPAFSGGHRLTGTTFSNGRYYFTDSVISNNNTIVGWSSLATLMSTFLYLLAGLLALLVIPPLLFYLFMIPSHKRLIAPLETLAAQMTEFSLGGNPPPLLETGDEIEALSKVFAHTAEKLNQQTQALVTSEQEKTITAYKLLTTQLDPHFVYNTMNIINIMARQQRYADIITVNNALRRILRERLNTGIDVFDTVENEVEALRQYMLIMTFRYENKVQVDCDVDACVAKCKIVKNIIQPLVENAFYHGLTDEEGVASGSVSVIVYPIDEHIVIEVSDDGKGFPPELLQNIRENGLHVNKDRQTGDAHIGLENIYNRLFYLYGEEFDMDINSETGFGTTIVVTIPKNDF